MSSKYSHNVIPNLFRDLSGRLEAKRVRRYAVIKRRDIQKLSGLCDFNHVIAHLLRDLKLVKERSRTKSAMTELLTVILNLFQNLILERSEYKPSPQPSPIGEGVSVQAQSKLQHGNVTNHHIHQSCPQGREKHSSRFTLHTSLKQCTAFTLAEVLITLGIIGVVAALTMPVLIADYQKKETLTKLKKTYSIFSQAVKQAELNEGETEYWDFTLSAKDFYKQYLKNYLNIGAEYIDKPLPKDMDYYTPSGGVNNASGGHQNTYTPKIFLNDGTFFTVTGINGSTQNSYSIVVNLNGYSHPNRWGRDIFAFAIVKGKGFVPYGQYTGIGEVGDFGDSLDRDQITKSGNTRACNKQQDGIWCAALIMLDGWEIKDDYPW